MVNFCKTDCENYLIIPSVNVLWLGSLNVSMWTSDREVAGSTPGHFPIR